MVAAHNMHDNSMATAIQSKDHLIRWLLSTNRNYIVLDSIQFVRSLPDGEGFVRGIEMLQQILSCYREHRGTLPAGYSAKIEAGMAAGQMAPVMRGETFDVEEWDDLLAWAATARAEALELRRHRTAP